MESKKTAMITLFILSLLTIAGCARETGPRSLTVMTHDSFAISEELIAGFEEQHHVDVVLLLSGDAGTALNKAILAKGAPLADVF